MPSVQLSHPISAATAVALGLSNREYILNEIVTVSTTAAAALLGSGMARATGGGGNSPTVFHASDMKAYTDSRTITNQTGTAYTYAIEDVNTIVKHTNASAVTATLPTNASVAIPIGTPIYIVQYGAGQVTVAAAGGVTLRAPGGAKTSAQYAMVTAWKIGTNEWALTGSTAT
jgi:phosphoenolpyruvate carboxylase